jgi:thioredoxin-dependent peroxiredoxin
MWKYWILAAGIALAVVAMARSNVTRTLEVGEPAPAFNLLGSDGKYYSLDQFRGKQAVVLAWFPKANTRG